VDLPFHSLVNRMALEREIQPAARLRIPCRFGKALAWHVGNIGDARAVAPVDSTHLLRLHETADDFVHAFREWSWCEH